MIKVYVIHSTIEERFYVGMTENLDRRLKEHNSGRTKSTKGFGPWELFFYEEFEDRREARKREKYLKSGYGKNGLRINGSLPNVIMEMGRKAPLSWIPACSRRW